jgi:phosphatidylglycerophosphate synthase
MSERSRATKALLHITPLLGVGLLAYLLTRVELGPLVANAKAIGWGMILIIALGGFAHVIKTWAWRLTLLGEARKVSFGRTLGLRLISEAIGQFGFVGMVGGEATRVSMLGSGVSLAGAISSVALDRTLFILAGAVVTIAGVVGLLFAVSVSHAVHIYLAALVVGLLLLLLSGAIAVERRWPLFSGPARAAAIIPWLRTWLLSKDATLKSAEERILEFYHEAPGAFWCSASLNLFSHFLAIVEVYLIMKMLGAPATLLGALIMESLTKLINVAGSVNPGNVGTYEGGNMVFGRLVRLTGTQGLLLALCRRLRAVFWAILGGICLLWFSRRRKAAGVVSGPEVDTSTSTEPAAESGETRFERDAAFILAHNLHDRQFEPALARVATLPVLLRAILSVRNKRSIRTIVVLNPSTGPGIQTDLLAGGRLPKDTEWIEVPARTTIPSILRAAGVTAGRVEFVRGNCTYRPSLFQMLHEWNGESGAIELVSSGKPIGLFALGHEVAEDLAAECTLRIENEWDLHEWLARRAGPDLPGLCASKEVNEDSWQAIARPEDCVSAERKLDRWLVKPTDGLFARMNRRVSIPISRQLIKFPISPNMVSLFTLGLSLVAGGFFALGGYWNSLLGALLGVLGSILDGCDGEVARLNLQVSDLGCWLDSICDYLYYLVTFAGIIVGVLRSTGDPRMIGWGILVFAGALLTFIMAGVGRNRMSGNRPEQYLAVWHKNAESQSSGLLLRMARHTEFVVRRCFLPYLILVLAVLNLMPVLVYMAAFGANVAWIVSLRSLIAFSGRRKTSPELAGSSRSERKPVIA